MERVIDKSKFNSSPKKNFVLSERGRTEIDAILGQFVMRRLART